MQDLYIKVTRVISEETADNATKVVVAVEARDGPNGRLFNSGTCVFYLSNLAQDGELSKLSKRKIVPTLKAR